MKMYRNILMMILCFANGIFLMAQHHTEIQSPGDDALLISSPGGDMGSGPVTRLECDYNSTIYNGVLALIPNDNTRMHRNNSIEMRSPTNGRINFFINPTSVTEADLKMTIRDDGDVGIGEADPVAKLHVSSDIDDVILMESAGGSVGQGPLARFRGEFNSTTYDAVVGMIPNDNTKPHRNNSIELRTPLNGRFNFFVNPTNVTADDLKMTIIDNGDVGIGEISPEAKLHLNADDDDVILLESEGGLLGQGPLTRYRADYNSTTYDAVVGMIPNDDNKPHRNNSIELRSPLNGRFNFFVNPTNVNEADLKMTIRDDGDVGIGEADPTAKLHVNSDIDDVILMESDGGNLGQGPLARFRAEYNSTTYDAVVGLIPNDNNKAHRNNSIELRTPTNGRFNFFVNPTNVDPADLKMTIIDNGNVGIGITAPNYLLHVNGTAAKPGGGSWTVASDKRLKKNIEYYTDGLAIINQINPVKFSYTEESGMDSEQEWVGILAQDMAKIVPHSISTFKGKDDEEYLAFDPSSLDFILINAVKELQKEVEALKKDIQERDLQLAEMANAEEE